MPNDATSLPPQPLVMHDPAGTGDLKLPFPEHKSSQEIADSGPVEVIVPAAPAEARTRAQDATEARPGKGPTLEKAPIRTSGKGNIWIVIPGPPPVSADEVWHYTDAAGMIGIMSSDTLWATSTSALNDSAEYQHGRQILEEILDEIRVSKYLHPLQKNYIESVVQLADTISESSGMFILSASEAGDSLAQWRLYGGRQPHAVVLSAKEQLTLLGSLDQAKTIDCFGSEWRKVLYSAFEQRHLLLRTLGFIACNAPGEPTPASESVESDRSNASVLVTALAHCKDESFSEEAEVRMVFRGVDPAAVRFRSGPVGVTPFVALTGSDGWQQYVVKEVKKLPVRRIVVGPFSTREASAKGTQVLLAQHHRDCPIEISKSTLR